MAEEVKLNYIMPAIEEAGWSKKTNQNGILSAGQRNMSIKQVSKLY